MVIPAHFLGSREGRNLLTLTLQLRRLCPGPEPCEERRVVTVPPSQVLPKFPGFGGFIPWIYSHGAAHTIPALHAMTISKEFPPQELLKELYPIWDHPSKDPLAVTPPRPLGSGAGLTPCSGSIPGNAAPGARNAVSSTAPSLLVATDPPCEPSWGSKAGNHRWDVPRDLLGLQQGHTESHSMGQRFPFLGTQIPIPWDMNSHSTGHKIPFHGAQNPIPWDTNSHSMGHKSLKAGQAGNVHPKGFPGGHPSCTLG